ncbi:ABC transporter substrate-binding protein [Pelagibacterium sp.]|uniref:ABC transporter substrate-binding protein n=1 Tax=Pelagibacterium sp. TaxID=1967288 RepID=UPI003A9088D0
MKKKLLGLMTAALLVTNASAAVSQEWSYTDGTGNTITLERPPERIVAFSSSAAGLMQFGIVPVGVFTDESTSDKSYADFDLSTIEVIRTAYNQLQAESLLALEPDLIVTEYWPRTGGYSGGDEMTPDGQFGGIAPILGVSQMDSILGLIEDYADLAQALGADIDAPQIQQQREAFLQAREAFSSAADSKPGLKVMAAWADAESLYVATPDGAAELNDFANWGLNVIEPAVPAGEYWGILSWENADAYPADVLLLDDRFGSATREAVQAQPLADLSPAIAAGQVGDWPAWWIRTYSAYAEQLEKLTALVDAAEVVTD